MVTRIHTTLIVHSPALLTFDHVISASAMRLFTGFGPVPGVQRARWLDGASPRELGARLRVDNTDGTHQVRQVVRTKPGREFSVRFAVLPDALQRSVAEMTEDWEFAPTEQGGTQVTRSLTVVAKKNWSVPVALLANLLLRPALQKNNRSLENALSGREQSAIAVTRARPYATPRTRPVPAMPLTR